MGYVRNTVKVNIGLEKNFLYSLTDYILPKQCLFHLMKWKFDQMCFCKYLLITFDNCCLILVRIAD